MTYRPTPLDTSKISLSASLDWIAEQLAANNHDVWARQRIEEGWSYGSERNDQLKQTPCLMHYDELPESEKEYDRNTAMQTLKAIIQLGFQIVDPQTGGADNADKKQEELCSRSGRGPAPPSA